MYLIITKVLNGTSCSCLLLLYFDSVSGFSNKFEGLTFANVYKIFRHDKFFVIHGRDAIIRVRVRWLVFNMLTQLWADVKYHVPTMYDAKHLKHLKHPKHLKHLGWWG